MDSDRYSSRATCGLVRAPGDRPDDLELALAEHPGRGRRPGGERLDDQVGAARVERGMPPVHGPDDPGQLDRVHVLERVPARAAAQRADEESLVEKGGEDNDGRVRAPAAQRGAHVQALGGGGVAELEVEQHHIGAQPRGLRDCLLRIRRLADHGEVRLKLQDGAEPLPDDRVVIDHQDPHRSGCGAGRPAASGGDPAHGAAAVPGAGAGIDTAIRRPPPRLRRARTTPPSSAVRSAMFRSPCLPRGGASDVR